MPASRCAAKWGPPGTSQTLRCFWHPTRQISLPALRCRSMAARSAPVPDRLQHSGARESRRRAIEQFTCRRNAGHQFARRRGRRHMGCRQLAFLGLFDAKPCHVQRRQEQERQQRPDDDASHHRVRHRPPKDLASDRNEPETCGSRGQHNRPDTVLCRLDHRLPGGSSFPSELLDLHNQDHRVTD